MWMRLLFDGHAKSETIRMELAPFIRYMECSRPTDETNQTLGC